MIHRSLILLLACILSVSPLFAAAATTAELQAQIDNNNTQIAQLNKEIAQYEAQLKTTTTQKNTLQNKINQLNTQKKKLQASIQVTQRQIDTTQAQIQQLAGTIATKQSKISNQQAALSESLRELNRADAQPLAVTVLAADTLSDAWQDVDAMQSIQRSVRQNISVLATEKQSLTQTKTVAEEKKATLDQQRQALSVQQGSLVSTIQTQAQVLAQTKQKESEYQTLIAKKKAQEASFEAALTNLKAQLNVNVNPSQIPTSGKGVLQWPVDRVVITQYFGNTAFASSGAYGGKGHNGMDFGVPIGTPIKAALTGTVVGTGNTDAVSGCYSFGKWVMIKHANGLNTMYAHLSQISVSTGQTVSTGQVLGYSGETGYATGPHLHFGVYVTAVTKIMRLGDATQSSTPCSGATMPVPPISGYLNPLNYLP